MDTPIGQKNTPLPLRDLCALARPLISNAAVIERFRQDPWANPLQVLKLLGMLGDLASSSLQAKKEILFPVPPLPSSSPPEPSLPPQSSPASQVLQDRKLVEALLGLQGTLRAQAPGSKNTPSP